MKQRIKQLVGALDEIIAALVLSFIILLTVSGVFLRYALSRPLPWQEELSLVAMVWLVLIGSSVVARRSGHVRIDTLIRLLPAKQQQVWRCIIHTLVLFVLGLVFYFSAQLTLQTQKLTTVLKIPYQFVYGAAPVSVLLMMFHTALALGKSYRLHRSRD